MTSARRRTIALALLAVASPLTHAENWPQWRGPFLNGSTTEASLPATFSKTENVVWTTPMPGQSGATPIVWGDRVFVSSTEERTRGLAALCLDARDGKVLWKRSTGRGRRIARNNMASPSPCTDGKRVYFYYGTASLFAFDFEGKRLWARDLERDHGYNALMFGYSSSPLLHDGRLYIVAIRNKRMNRYRRGPTGRCESYVLAIDATTGQDLWKQFRPTDARDEAQEAYTTAIPLERDDGRTEILVYGADFLTAHDPESGEELWRWATYNPRKINHWRVVPSPVVAGGLIILVGPKHSRMFAIRPATRGLAGDDHVVWTFDRLTPDASTPLYYRGRLYVLDDDRKVITCFDPKSGRQHWQGRLGGRAVIRASLTGADGRIYGMNEKGEVFVLAAGDEFRVLHRVAMGNRGLDRSSIVAANGRLFIRTTEALYCIAEH